MNLEEIDKEFDEAFPWFEIAKYGKGKPDELLLKDFIHKALTKAREEERQELIKKIEGMKLNTKVGRFMTRWVLNGYNSALDDIKNLLNV